MAVLPGWGSMAIERLLTRGRIGVVVVSVAGLLLLMLAAAVSGPEVTGLPLPSREWITSAQSGASSVPSTAPTPTPSSSAQPPPTLPPFALLTVILSGLVLVAVLAGLWFLVSRLRPRRPERLRIETLAEPESAPEEGTPATEIRAAVDRGLQQLDESVDPRTAVIACWLRLEEAAARAGTDIRPEDTPADLVARVLGSRDLDADVLRRLADLYRHARFGPDVVEASMREEARELLERLRSELPASGS